MATKWTVALCSLCLVIGFAAGARGPRPVKPAGEWRAFRQCDADGKPLASETSEPAPAEAVPVGAWRHERTATDWRTFVALPAPGPAGTAFGPAAWHELVCSVHVERDPVRAVVLVPRPVNVSNIKGYIVYQSGRASVVTMLDCPPPDGPR